MDPIVMFFWWIVCMISFWILEKFSGNTFKTNLLTSAIASVVFLGLQTLTVAGVFWLFSVNPSLVLLYVLGGLLLEPVTIYFTFWLCNLLLPGFKAKDRGVLFKASIAFFGYTLVGTLCFAILNFLGIFLFFGGAYRTRDYYYGWFNEYWYFDRYFYD